MKCFRIFKTRNKSKGQKNIVIFKIYLTIILGSVFGFLKLIINLRIKRILRFFKFCLTIILRRVFVFLKTIINLRVKRKL